MAIQITKEIRDKIVQICLKHDVSKIALFGSILYDTFTDESDIDLIVKFDGEKTILNLISLKIDLEEQLNKNIDILTFNSINPLMRESIENEMVVIYS